MTVVGLRFGQIFSSNLFQHSATAPAVWFRRFSTAGDHGLDILTGQQIFYLLQSFILPVVQPGKSRTGNFV
jgi:hypothetical protein